VSEPTQFVNAPAGNRIAVDRFGPEDGPAVILLPGSAQTRHSWRRTARRLGDAGRAVWSADLRSHGDSDPAPDGDYSYPRLMEDALALLDAANGPAALVGASVGGKIFLAAAAALPPAAIACLVLVDAVSRTNRDGAARVAELVRSPPDGFASVREAAACIARFSGRDVASDAEARLRRSMRRRADGRWSWHWDAPFFDDAQGLGISPSLRMLEDAATRIAAPTMLIRGERSDFVNAEGTAALAALMPQLEVAVLPGAGHMILGDHNDCIHGIADRLPGPPVADNRQGMR